MTSNHGKSNFAIGAGLFLSALATVVGSFVGYVEIIPSIIAALILVGPSMAASGFVVSSYSSWKNQRNDTVLLSIAIWQAFLCVPLASRTIAIMNGEESLGNEKLSAFDLLSPRGVAPLEQAIRLIRELQTRLEATAEKPAIEKSDHLPWEARSELFEFPNFRIVDRSVTSLSTFRSDAWVSFSVATSLDWYESVAIRLTMFSNGQGITDMKTGVVEARNFAELQRDYSSTTVTVEPENYLRVVDSALRHSGAILERIQKSKCFGDRLVGASSRLAIEAEDSDR